MGSNRTAPQVLSYGRLNIFLTESYKRAIKSFTSRIYKGWIVLMLVWPQQIKQKVWICKNILDVCYQNQTHWDHPVGKISIFWHLHGSQHCQVDVTPKQNDITEEDSCQPHNGFNLWTHMSNHHKMHIVKLHLPHLWQDTILRIMIITTTTTYLHLSTILNRRPCHE